MYVKWYCTHAEPTAKKFTEGQLKPAADKVAANAKPTADRFNNEQLLPAADKIAQNAKPTADKLTEGQIKPAAQKIHDEAVPRTKDFTEGTLQPGAKRLADNAEPMADKLIKQGVEPLADVSTSPASCFCSHFSHFCLGVINVTAHTLMLCCKVLGSSTSSKTMQTHDRISLCCYGRQDNG